MNISPSKNKLSLLILIFASAVLSIMVNFFVFLVQSFSSGGGLELYLSEKYAMELSSYSSDENGYFTVTGEDPQLIFRNVDCCIGHIELKLGEPAAQNIRVQLYYNDDMFGFSEEKSFIDYIPEGGNRVEFDLKGIKCSELRFDIDGDFRLGGLWAEKKVNLSLGSILLTEFFLLFAIAAYKIWQRLPEKEDKLNIGELVFWILCSGYFFIWSSTKPFNYAPDEYMRYSVSAFLFENNRLPVGAETTDNPWGFSYAHMPTMLCNYLGFIPMKLVSLFTSNDYALVVAARFGSVLCGSVCLLFLIKSAKLMIKKPFHWVMIIFVALMPQFCFLCSYINNDICALCGAAIILYSWVRIIREGFNIPVSVILAMGIGITGISYYNSYGWALMSVITLLSYIIINRNERKKLFKQGLLIMGITIVIMAYPFVRQYIVYGDLLGFKVTAKYGELYAIDSLKPSARQLMTVQAQGISLWDMLFGMGWIESVFQSFVGVFGYMAYAVNPVIIKGYLLLLCGMAGILVYIIVRGIKNITGENIRKEYRYIIFYVCLIGTMIIPVILSIVYSYSNDYQAQGRYIYPMMPGLALLFGLAYSELFGKFKNIRVQNATAAALCGVMVFFNVWAFFETYLPS